MKKKILVALNDTVISHSVLDHLIDMEYFKGQYRITLLHVFRKGTAEETLMGRKFTQEQKPRMTKMLENAKEKLVNAGFDASLIEIKLVTEQFPTITDGIVAQFNSDNYDMVIIGRKQMSKSEEFVLGDISIKLIRILENTAVVVVKMS